MVDAETSDSPQAAKKRIPWQSLTLLWLAGFDLRVTLLAIPPLLPRIHRDLALSETAVAALLGLPILLLAGAATAGSMLISRFDARRAVIFGIILVGASSAMRGAGPSTAMLFAMTFVMGASVSVVQPAMPALVYHWAPDHIGLATAVYTNGLLMGELAAAGFTTQVILPLLGSWELALAFWGLIPILSGIVLWQLSAPLGVAEARDRSNWLPDFGNALTWRLGLIQGGTSTIYYGANTFFPDYLHAAGASRLIPTCLVWLNGSQFPASIIVALFPGWFVGRTWPIQMSAPITAAALGIFFLPHEWARIAGATTLGFLSALAFVLNLVFPPLLAEEPGDVHRISAGMFTIGYGLASLMPLLGGVAWDRSGVAEFSLAPVAIGSLCLLFAPWGLRTRDPVRTPAA
jgi:MFS transporter, CP family, cyanate transporter